MNVSVAAGAAIYPRDWPKNIAIPGPDNVAVDRVTSLFYVCPQDRSGSESVKGSLLHQRSIKWDERGWLQWS